MAESPKETTPRSLGRRLRAHVPVSPLSSHWNKWGLRGLLAGILVLALGGALASILLQGGDDESQAAPALDASKRVAKVVNSMSLGQKADAVVISGFEGTDGATQLAGEAQLGGLLVGPEDWFGVAKGKALNAQIHSAGSTGGRIPPLVVARQEGGVYRSYPDLPPALGQREVAATGDPAEATSWATETGNALANAGFDLNLAPIADVATLDSPLSDRAFGDDAQLVGAMTSASVRGCRDTGIACATPYFPGLGASSGSTSEGPATVGLSANELAARDLLPFRNAIKGGVPAIVLSLALYSAYDPVTPAALSPSVAGGLLRDQLGFKGVAISDDLSAGVAATGIAAPQAAAQALTAGIDMAVVSNQAQATAARKAILEAARSGGLPAARLDQAVARIVTLKQKLGL
jgi:beta-N-acetylhexosaminidase